MVMAEVALLGGIPVNFKHAALAPTFAGCYQLFLWFMSSRSVRFMIMPLVSDLLIAQSSCPEDSIQAKVLVSYGSQDT